jgi:hypothetical protein
MEQRQDAAIAGDGTPKEIPKRSDEGQRKIKPYQKKRTI